MTPLTPVFDLDGTLLDSDRAIVEPFLDLGLTEDRIEFGLPLAQACSAWGVSLDDYLAAYDVDAAQPFPGVDRLLAALPRWAIFSNKYSTCGEPELERLGWKPDAVFFSEWFGGPKGLHPVLDALQLSPSQIICVGDSEQDRSAALEVGAAFALAGWNPRAVAVPGDVALSRPADLLDLVR